jgi:antitoxin component YwqK of YwqJK toxin-antitoxin module
LGALKAVLNYDNTGAYAHARLYYEDGNLAAEGLYYNALKDSTWVYYSYYDKTVTSKENFQKGIRQGTMVNFYSNGEPSEKIEWKNNKMSGVWEQFYLGDKLKLRATYVDNKLEGEFHAYHPDGKPYVTGEYLKNLRNGKWTFYGNDGSVQKELNYTNGKVLEEQKLNEEQQEIFRLIDENQGKFEEPDESNFLAPQSR